jgi:hypothetical protein
MAIRFNLFFPHSILHKPANQYHQYSANAMHAQYHIGFIRHIVTAAKGKHQNKQEIEK